MNPAIRAAWYWLYEPMRFRWEEMRWRDGPLVSVYVPTFNRKDLLLSRAIPSVLQQTYGNWELIVAAHGCTDGTQEAVGGIDPRIRLIEVPRTRTYPPTAENHWFAGPVVPANAALRECRGQWIARIDDDDVWRCTHLESLLDFARNGDWDFVSARHATPNGIADPYVIDGVRIGGTQTWLYRSSLKFMKYNPDCWKKKHNRVNDTDLQARIRHVAKMGYLEKIVTDILPRPGEQDIGLKAYLNDRQAKERDLSFAG